MGSADWNTASMMRRLARREYSLVMATAGHKETQAGGSGSTVVKAILATATAAASYPTVDDFRADVNGCYSSTGFKVPWFKTGWVSKNLDGPQREPPGGTLIVKSFYIKYSYHQKEMPAILMVTGSDSSVHHHPLRKS